MNPFEQWNERHVRRFRPRYDGLYWNFVQRHLYRNVVYFLSIYDTILDVGCGDGVLPRKFIGYRGYTGVDVSKTMVKRARHKCFRGYTGVDVSKTMVKRARHKCFRVANAEHLPFADDSFDAIVSIDALEHMADPLSALREMRRVMRTGGQTVITVPNEPFRNALKRCMGIAQKRDSWHLTCMDKKRITAMCEEAGLHPWWMGYSPFGLFPMNIILKCSK